MLTAPPLGLVYSVWRSFLHKTTPTSISLPRQTECRRRLVMNLVCLQKVLNLINADFIKFQLPSLVIHDDDG